MNYTYDIILNFSDYERYYEFYEWKREDNLLTIEKIPIIKINRDNMELIINNKIKINKEILGKIENKTILSNGEKLKYVVLFTDLSKVIAIEFNNQGEFIKSSGLLLDEEEAVIDECLNYKELDLEFDILNSFQKTEFLTREEKNVKNSLIMELKYLYKNKNFDEINYLYEELYNEKMSIHKKYDFLINDIENNFNSKYHKLYDIIKLT